ncbi:hypothetical protein MHJ95_02600 [Corynebacterium imitans]|uniref:hypothetical protein n=1 Tax=Corynebacterium imitans TaxID=156978 RepID=UPI001EF2805F|nr:hypothetical protein [Corynebacterium imitans]MCG7277888.1 hypothetical protein [Corynebacterium imitans]
MTDGSFPFVIEPTRQLRFTLNSSTLKIAAENAPANIFQVFDWPIDKRLAWFLEKSSTLSLVMVGDDSVWVSCALGKSSPPLIGSHPGTVRSKNYVDLIVHSHSWHFGRLGNVSVAADKADFPDDYFQVFASDENGVALPSKLAQSDTCVSCDNPANSREHCTPDWIARDQDVQPVTAHLFCKSCNRFFGEKLENPMAQMYRSGTLPRDLNSKVFVLWAIKTALTLAVASGVRIETAWLRKLRNYEIPDGFEVYADATIQSESKGYSYGVTLFSTKRHQSGNFLTTFAMPGLVLSVVRTTPLLGEFGPLPRIHPSYLDANQVFPSIELSELHSAYLSEITGNSIYFEEEDARRPQNRAK